MSISRIDQPERYNHGYYVRLTRNRKTQSKFFADKANGGKRAALRAAKQHEAELLKQAEAKSGKRRQKVSARNRSGIVGVSRGVWEEGGREAAYWQAAWVGGRGERRSKKYSVNKYGEERAKRLAIKARREAVRERERER
jgi:AP2 domain